MCSKCQREVHQSGPSNGWEHCEDQTPRCEGAASVYPSSPGEIKGKWCGVDSCGMQPEFDVISRPRLKRRKR